MKTFARAASRGGSISRIARWALAGACALALIGITTAAASVRGHSASTTVVRTVFSPIYQARLLTNSSRHSLYVFCVAADLCKHGHASSKWIPLIAHGTVVGRDGVKQSKLGTRRIDGKRVVTYYGDALYTYDLDRKPGDINGEDDAQGNGGWFLIGKYGHPVFPNSY